MSLAPGTRVGRFEIRSQLGAGGMGEVYRARDPNIDRDVAIKILPHEFSTDPRRLQRFEQEARATGRLNHPNILAIHDIDLHNGLPFVVYELLEGETLREHLNHGPLAQRKVVDYSLQIARGLAAAHAKSIVHRDLKPDNIFITTDERVKILDFGLAKLYESVTAGEQQSEIETRKVNTNPGAVMGTVGYMSPEQVRGELVDHRSDIFALGVIVYEMVSGERAFRGDSTVETLNAILKEDPADLTTKSNIHPSFNRVMRRCLEKKPDERFQSASDFAFALEAISEGSQSSFPPLQAPIVSRRFDRKYLFLIAAVLAILLVGAFVLFPRGPSTNSAGLKFLLYPPENSFFSASDLPFPVAVSPDGQVLALVLTTNGQNRIWLRRLNTLKAVDLEHTQGAQNPFWSPDGRFIGFFADGKLKKIAVSGGVPLVICDAPPNANSGTWNQEDTILFTSGVLEKGILRVSANGGEPVEITRKDESRHELVHFWPHFLPDGRHFLYLVGFSQKKVPLLEVYVSSIDSTEKKLLPGISSHAMYSPPGYLLYVRDGALLAQPFDLKSLSLSGEQMTVTDQVGNFSRIGNAYFSVSANGEVLAYITGGSPSRLVVVNEQGSEEAELGKPDDYVLPRLSPDGSKLAVDITDRKDGTNDIWIYDLTRKTFTKFTFDTGMSNAPVWSPDAQRIIYAHDRDGPPHLFMKSFNDSNEGELLLAPRGEGPESAFDVSPDGKFLIYREYHSSTKTDLMVLPMTGERTPQPFSQTPFNETDGRFSPDGKWVAYSSDESGRREVYVKQFQGGTDRVQISTNGGRAARWSRDGKTLFYVTSDLKLMAVPVKIGKSLEAGTPAALFSIAARNSDYDVFPDGKRFLVNTNSGAPPVPLIVSTNWANSLKR